MTKLEKGSYTLSSKGHIIFKRRGKAPNFTIDGFTRDPNDPYVFTPDFRDCTQRKQRVVTMQCGKEKVSHYCLVHNKTVNSSFCEDCDLITEEGNLINESSDADGTTSGLDQSDLGDSQEEGNLNETERLELS